MKLAVGLSTSILLTAGAAPGADIESKQSPIAIGTYEPSGVLWERGTYAVGPAGSDMQVTLSFAFNGHTLNQLRIAEGRWSVDLSSQVEKMGQAFPTRAIASFQQYDARGAASTIEISLPFSPSEGGCYSRNLKIVEGHYAGSYDTKVSAVRCEP